MRKIPNFFVVGAPKAGTSALYEFLRQHPDIFVPDRKELHYFTTEHASQSYYRPRLIHTEAQYRRHFRGAGRQLAVGDFSPSYLYSPDAVQRIRAFNTDAKIVVILRDPAERTISHYLMDVAKGFQARPLNEFLRRTPENSAYHFEYIANSHYSEGTKRYIRTFGRENVLVLIAEDLRACPASVCETLFRFLGVDDTVSIDTDAEHNPFFTPRFAMTRILRRSAIAFAVYQAMPRGMRAFTQAILQRRDVDKPDLSQDRLVLRRLFRPEVERVERLLGRDMSDVWFSAPQRAAALGVRDVEDQRLHSSL